MEVDLLARLLITKRMAKEDSTGQMEATMKAISRKVSFTVLVSTTFKTSRKPTSESLLTELCRVRAKKCGLMAANMSATS